MVDFMLRDFYHNKEKCKKQSVVINHMRLLWELGMPVTRAPRVLTLLYIFMEVLVTQRAH